MTPRAPQPALPLSATDFHVLLVLSEGPLYGYAVMKAVEEETGGVIAPDVGSLYRILARLMESGLVEETDPTGGAGEVHRGRPRRYYGMTPAGAVALRAEAARLADAVDLARARKLLPEGGA